MIQLVVNNIFLDLYENDSPKLTYSIEDLLDTKVTSIYSKTFRVPATKQNTKFFKSAFEINGFDFDVTIKINASILLDGQEFRKGQIRLQKIYLTNEGNAADYEIIFLGESRNFASDVGQGYINELDYSELNTVLTYANVSASWAAYPQSSSLTAGLHSGSLLFPLVDFGNTYSGSTVEQTRMAVGTGRHFTNPAQTWPLQVNRFRPMVRAKFVWDKIFDEAGYTYTSEFLNSEIFHQLYISAWGNEPYVEQPQSSSINHFRAVGPQPGNSVYNILYNSDYYDVTSSVLMSSGFPGASNNNGFDLALGESFDYGNNYANAAGSIRGYYTAPTPGQYRFTYKIYIELESTSGLSNTEFEFQLRLKRYRPSSGVTTTIKQLTNPVNENSSWAEKTNLGGNILPYGSRWESTFSDSVLTTAVADDQYYVEFFIIDKGTMKIILLKTDLSLFECVNAPGGALAIGSFIKSDYKKIDFIKDIITRYRLVFAPDPNNLTNFFIEPWKDYVATGEVYDWTQKLDYSKDVIVEPLFNTQKAIINFTDKEDKDWLNALNVNQFNEVYGALEFNSQNELLTDEREIKTSLASTPVRQIQGFFETSTVARDFIIPHIYTIESTEEGVKYNPISPTTRLLFYNGMKSGNDTWYAQAEGGGTTYTLTQYPMVSPYSDWPIVDSTIDLNWQRENGYQYVTASGVEPYKIGSSVYDIYWESYITSLYEAWGRKVTAYFTLEGYDLKDFSFNDIIYVKGTYYYVETIYDVPLDRREPVKVDLIKYPYIVPNTNFAPPVDFNVWGEWLVDWDTTTDTWDD